MSTKPGRAAAHVHMWPWGRWTWPRSDSNSGDLLPFPLETSCSGHFFQRAPQGGAAPEDWVFPGRSAHPRSRGSLKGLPGRGLHGVIKDGRSLTNGGKPRKPCFTAASLPAPGTAVGTARLSLPFRGLARGPESEGATRVQGGQSSVLCCFIYVFDHERLQSRLPRKEPPIK